MVKGDLPRKVRRTLVLGLGEDGWEAVRLLAERLKARHDGLPCVACLGILPEGDSLDGAKAVTPEGASSGPVKAITEALAEISRIGHGRALRARGFLLDCPDEVALAVVAGLDAPHAAEMVLDLAYLARHLIRSRLNSHALSVGILLLPDILAADEPAGAWAHARSCLEALDAYMGPHDGFQRRYGGGLKVEEWGPPFNTCYLAGTLNADGLALASSEERANLVGEFLYRLLFSPLGEALRGLEPIAATFGSHRGFYGAFGLASWVYPAREMAEAAARKLAARMAGHILSLSDDGGSSGAYSFLASREFVPQALEEALLPPGVLAEAGWDRGLEVSLSWPGIAAWRGEVDEEASRRQEELARRRSHLEGEAAKAAASLAKDVEEELGKRLDDPKPGGIGRARCFLQGVQEALEDFAAREKDEADKAFEALKAVEERIEEMAGQLDALAEGFPRNVRQLLALALRPGRWLALWRRWRAFTRARSLYLALLERRLQQVATIMRRDLAVRACREAIPLVEELGQKLNSLAEVLEGLAAPQWEGENALYGSLSFELERSILTPELVEALYAEVEGDLGEQVGRYLEERPLSQWLKGQVEASHLAQGLLSYARRRCQVLTKVDMARLVGTRWSERDLEEELERLSEEAKPFLAWDETALDEAESGGMEEALLLEAEGLPPSLRRRLETPERGWRIVNGGDPHRWTVLRMIRGLPLEAVLSHNI